MIVPSLASRATGGLAGARNGKNAVDLRLVLGAHTAAAVLDEDLHATVGIVGDGRAPGVAPFPLISPAVR